MQILGQVLHSLYSRFSCVLVSLLRWSLLPPVPGCRLWSLHRKHSFRCDIMSLISLVNFFFQNASLIILFVISEVCNFKMTIFFFPQKMLAKYLNSEMYSVVFFFLAKSIFTLPGGTTRKYWLHLRWDFSCCIFCNYTWFATQLGVHVLILSQLLVLLLVLI